MRTGEPRGGGYAVMGGVVYSEVIDVTHDVSAMDSGGMWALVASYEGSVSCIRFAQKRDGTIEDVARASSAAWPGVHATSWNSSLSREQYIDGVECLRQHIAAGDVYQANLCRVLSAPLSGTADVAALGALLAIGNPAPFACVIDAAGYEVASASPELFLQRQGRTLWSSPIKGTGRVESDLTEKDRAENVMIVDLVRNDLGAVCEVGTVGVPSLLEVQEHPGLVHLVSTVSGTLRQNTSWSQIFDATFPPGSVTGAPKSSALRLLREIETAARGPYCGALGIVDGDNATLAVGIRTFWKSDSSLHFGTGAGITWGSDPIREWQETELKAARLLALASQKWKPHES